MIASQIESQSEVYDQNEPIQAKPAFTPLIAGTDKAKQVSQQGVKARLAKQAQAKLALIAASQTGEQLDEFTAKRLTRVREMLDIVDAETKRCLLSKDPDDLDRVKPLVESSSRLSEQERFAANRPGPGTRKPQPERKSRGPSLTVCAEESD